MEDSLTITFSGASSTLEAQYFPPIELSPNKNYVLGLVELLIFNSIPNKDSTNNKFYVAGHVVSLPVGSYEIEDIDKILRKKLARDDITFNLKPNNITLRCSIKFSLPIDFRPANSLGSLLGFTKRVLEPNVAHNSDLPVTILKINALRVECNITSGAYINNQKVHSIHEFFPAVPPGYKIIEDPAHIIYLPITVKCIDHLHVRIVDEDGDLVNFRGEVITIRLHIRQS